MTERRHLTLIAAAATLLSAAPMSLIFATWTWAIEATLVVGAVCGAALAARALRVPVWAQAAGTLAALLLMLTWLFSSGRELVGVLPSGGTFQHFRQLISGGFTDIRDQGIPVPDRPGLLFLTTAGIGVVAVMVDIAAVAMRRPALAGFPMLAMYSIPVFIKQSGVSIVPFVIGATGFLWLLVSDNVDRVRRFGRRFTGDGRDVDLWEPSPLAAAGRRLTVIGVLLAVLLPLAVPQLTSNFMINGLSGNGSGSGGGGIGGRGANVDLFSALSGNLNRNQQFDMVKVTTNDPNPYYLRFAVADEVLPTGFRSRTPTGGTPVPSTRFTGPTSDVSQQAFHADVSIVNMPMYLLPIYLQPNRMSRVDGNWLYDPGTQVVYSNKVTARGKTYGFDYIHADYTPATLERSPALSPDDPHLAYTQVPSVPAVDHLVEQLTAGKSTVYDKVRALYDYFSSANGFSYSLTTKTGTSGSDIVDFLNNKQGYCEQYAAALAWLIRDAKIPARVAFGFTRGSNHQGNTYTLTNFNLHAWTEVYFAGFGWVPFDATPTSNIAGSVSPAWAPDVNHHDAVTPDPQNTPGSNASAAPGAGAASGPHDSNPNDTGSAGASAKHAATWPAWTLGFLLGLAVLLALPALNRLAVRRRRLPRLRPGTPGGSAAVGAETAPGVMRVVDGAGSAGGQGDARRYAHAAWDELMDTLEDHQIPLDPTETPRLTAQRVDQDLRLPDPVAAALAMLGQAEERARYARTPMGGVDLAAALRAVRHAIMDRVSRRTRLRAVVLPPSILRRWRTGSAAGISWLVNRAGRVRDRFVRLVSPRRLLPGRAR